MWFYFLQGNGRWAGDGLGSHIQGEPAHQRGSVPVTVPGWVVALPCWGHDAALPGWAAPRPDPPEYRPTTRCFRPRQDQTPASTQPHVWVGLGPSTQPVVWWGREELPGFLLISFLLHWFQLLSRTQFQTFQVEWQDSNYNITPYMTCLKCIINCRTITNAKLSF